jgi:oxygen-independent coproporphyrinogen-3 oxidase
MIGLGVSSSSDSWYSFAQNEKNMKIITKFLEWDKLPILEVILTDKTSSLETHPKYHVSI